jgi:hypothetical protein
MRLMQLENELGAFSGTEAYAKHEVSYLYTLTLPGVCDSREI